MIAVGKNDSHRKHPAISTVAPYVGGGQFEYKSRNFYQTREKSMKSAVIASFFLVCCVIAQAQDRTYLSKSEVEQFIVGKTVTYLRSSDGSKIKWDIRSGGMLYGSNLTTSRTDSAKWEIKDDGAMCLKWRGSSQDGCFFHFKNGDKLVRTENNQPTAPFTEIIEIQ